MSTEYQTDQHGVPNRSARSVQTDQHGVPNGSARSTEDGYTLEVVGVPWEWLKCPGSGWSTMGVVGLPIDEHRALMDGHGVPQGWKSPRGGSTL